MKNNKPYFLSKTINLIIILISAISSYSQSHNFVHPGIPWTINDLDEMKNNREVFPWSEGWDDIVGSSQASLNYSPQGATANVDRKDNNITNDGNAALYHALQWYFTNNSEHAEKAISILENWAAVHKTFSGNAVHLHAAWRGGTIVKAAEILRHTYSGWTDTNTTNCETYFQNVLWPQFRLPNPLRAANQGANNLWGAIQVAIFCNDQTKFAQCIDAFLNDECGGISNSLPNGQIGDSGRDQGHAGGHIGNLVSVAEIAWAQGIDLYGVLDNRLLAISEYWCKYNSGEEVEFINHGTCYNYFTSIGADNRDDNSPHVRGMLETIRGAYVVRKGVSAPYTTEYLGGIGHDEDTFFFRKDEDYNSTASFSDIEDGDFVFSEVTNLTSADIGNVDFDGSSNFNNGIWTVEGSGNEIASSNEDSFHFAYVEMTGDGGFLAKITSLTNTDPNAKAAIVIRENLEDDAKMAGIYARGAEGYQFQARGFDAADGSGSLSVNASSLPIWVKIERRGNNIVGFVGPDGVSWSAMQNTLFTMSDNYYIGLGVTSHNNNFLGAATFTDVKVSDGEANPSSCINTASNVEAECFNEMKGIQIEDNNLGGKSVAFIQNNDWVKYSNIDLTNMNSIEALASSQTSGGNLEIFIDGLDNELLGTISITNTTGWQKYESFNANIADVTGVHDVFFKFTGGNGFLFNLDSVSFSEDTVLSNTFFESNLNTLSIYPNPVKSTFVIKGATDATIIIYDVNGQILLTKRIFNQINEIDISAFVKGMYFVKINSLKNTSVMKIIKK